MTELVPVHKGRATQVSLTELQDRLDARRQIAETRSVTSTKKARVEEAKRAFDVDPGSTLFEIRARARALADTFDDSITLDSIPLRQDQINTLSRELIQLERLQAEVAALDTRYKTLIFAHLDNTLPRVPGRPASQVPGKVAAEGPGPHHVFERRGGNRMDPGLNTDSLREALPAEIVAQIYKTVHHEAVFVPAHDEEVFDVERFGALVDEGKIDLDVVGEHLTPGKWRSPAFYKTPVDGNN